MLPNVENLLTLFLNWLSESEPLRSNLKKFVLNYSWLLNNAHFSVVTYETPTTAVLASFYAMNKGTPSLYCNVLWLSLKASITRFAATLLRLWQVVMLQSDNTDFIA